MHPQFNFTTTVYYLLVAGQSSANRLLNAASSGNLNLLKKLGKELGYGQGVRKALIRVKDSNGRGALHYAVAGGKTHVCKYLVEDLKLDVNATDNKGDTPPNIATLEDQYLTSAYILNHGAQPNMAGCNQMTVLHCAAEKGRKNHLRLLISKGAEVDAKSFRGTPLQCAAANGMKDSVKILLDNHANPNTVSHHVYSPLMVAILAESVDCVRLLLKGGADPNMGSCGVTPLIVAASEAETEMIKCLLKAGADPNVTNFYDLTPIEIAAINGSVAGVMALFHATKQISSIPDWSCHGILEYVHSDEAKSQRKLKVEEKFLEAKAKGAEAFNRSDYLNAIFWYTEAINAKPLDATVLSNRSLCWARLNEGDYAINDAMACIMLKDDWPKAYYRAGVAWKILQDNRRAVEAYERGLQLDPENKELKDAYRESVADLRADLRNKFGSLSINEDHSDYDDYSMSSMFGSLSINEDHSDYDDYSMSSMFGFGG